MPLLLSRYKDHAVRCARSRSAAGEVSPKRTRRRASIEPADRCFLFHGRPGGCARELPAANRREPGNDHPPRGSKCDEPDQQAHPGHPKRLEGQQGRCARRTRQRTPGSAGLVTIQLAGHSDRGAEPVERQDRLIARQPNDQKRSLTVVRARARPVWNCLPQ